MASLLEAGCVALAFQERMHAVITNMASAPTSATLSTVLSFGRQHEKWMSAQLIDSLQQMDIAAAAAAAAGTRRDHPKDPEKFLIDAAGGVLSMHEFEAQTLAQRVSKARTFIAGQTTMPQISKGIMDSLTACRDLARLANDIGARLDVDAVLARYADPVTSTASPHLEAERTLCRAFGVPRAEVAQTSAHLARVELVRSLTFMGYELCYRDGLVQADARKRFDELVAQARGLAARQKPLAGPSNMNDAMTDAERTLYQGALQTLKDRNMTGAYRLSGRVFVASAVKVSPRGQAHDHLAALRRVPENATKALNDFTARFENSEPGIPAKGLIPIHIDPERPSLSLHDALLRALHATGDGKLTTGDVICFVRSESESEDGPRGMYMNQDAAKLCEKLRQAGIVLLAGISNSEERTSFEGQCDGIAATPKDVADLARSLLLRRKLEDTAMLRLQSTRRQAATPTV
ncbi:hypothetical protein [Roseateles asaccharophilus]|uniref:hypothetical protein n=1 Tax=Roseateles asaccharophilus TaxID=582607 RepID=UPI00384EC28A